jgi:hypothetical protein
MLAVLTLISLMSSFSFGKCWNIENIRPLSTKNYHTQNFHISAKLMAGFSGVLGILATKHAVNAKEQFEYQPALSGLDYGKIRTIYPDFTQAKSGLQYKVVKDGEGKSPSVGKFTNHF